MRFNPHTDSLKNAPMKGPDIVLPAVICIAAIMPFGRLKSYVRPIMIAIFRRQFSAIPVYNRLFSCQSNLAK
jgi:hypothetical protein